MLEQSAERLSFNVVRCRYAEMYRALGMADLGSSLSCQRDFALAEGFSPEIELTRTQTLMEGRRSATSGSGGSEPRQAETRSSPAREEVEPDRVTAARRATAHRCG